ncbi:furin-like protease 2 [Trichonephila clavipes]|nr:furin-like protease 2 [Trichonephila clavipes]
MENILHFSECTYKCPIGQYGDLSDYTCHMCDKSCSSCYGPSYNNCLSCSRHFLSNNMCVKTCPSGFFPDSEKHQCFPCLPVCSECEVNEVCTACQSGLFLYDQKCIPICPDGTYVHKQTCRSIECVDGRNTGEYARPGYLFSPASSLAKRCQKCHLSCASCYGSLSTNCITCPTPHVLYNGSCHSQCPLHYYSNDDYVCVRCHRSCEHCMDSDSCTKCHSNWERNSGDNCIYNSKCAGGWYNPHLDSCEACYLYCDQCSGPNVQDCVYCDSRYVWHEGHCIEQCPEGSFNAQDECIPCEEHCSRCKNTEKCLSCNEGFVLHFGKCYRSCPVGYYDNGKKECNTCHPECHHCIGGSNSNCTSCPVGYLLVQHTCIPQCPDSFFLVMNVEEENHCLPCYSTCKTCSDVCVNSGHPRSVIVNLSPQDYDEVVIPLRHIVPIVVVICFSVVLLYVFVFGLLQINSMGMCNFKFRRQKYERVPNNMAAKFDAEMEKISLTRDDLEDEDDIYEKV